MALNITPATILSAASSASNIVSNSADVDIVAVFSQSSLVDQNDVVRINNTQIFAEARPVRATVRETARVMSYPVETGAVLSDHRISNPTEIDLVCVIPEGAYSSAYPAIRNAWVNATLLSVQTRVGTYNNMIISDLPHDEEPDMYNAVTLVIKLREVIFVAPASISSPQPLANFLPANPAYTSTINRGLLSGVTAAGSALSYFHAGTVWGVPI